MTAPGEPPDLLIEMFQKQRREFQPQWNRNFFRIMLPGFLLFLLAHPMVLDIRPLLFVAIPLFFVGLMRGFYLAHRHLRCPMCNRMQYSEKRYPQRICIGCGNALSYGWEDS